MGAHSISLHTSTFEWSWRPEREPTCPLSKTFIILLPKRIQTPSRQNENSVQPRPCRKLGKGKTLWVLFLTFFITSQCSAQYSFHLANKTDCDFSVTIDFCGNTDGITDTLYAMSTTTIPSTFPAWVIRVHILGNPNADLAVSFALENPEMCEFFEYFPDIGANPCGSGNHNFQSYNNGFLYSFSLY